MRNNENPREKLSRYELWLIVKVEVVRLYDSLNIHCFMVCFSGQALLMQHKQGKLRLELFKLFIWRLKIH